MFATPSQSPPRGEFVPPSRVDDETALARNSQVLRFGHCEVRFAHREILVDGAPRALQPRPFDLLAYLIENRERVVTSGELLAQVWPDTRAQPCSLPSRHLAPAQGVGRRAPRIHPHLPTRGLPLRRSARVGCSAAARCRSIDHCDSWRANAIVGALRPGRFTSARAHPTRNRPTGDPGAIRPGGRHGTDARNMTNPGSPVARSFNRL